MPAIQTSGDRRRARSADRSTTAGVGVAVAPARSTGAAGVGAGGRDGRRRFDDRPAGGLGRIAARIRPPSAAGGSTGSSESAR